MKQFFCGYYDFKYIFVDLLEISEYLRISSSGPGFSFMIRPGGHLSPGAMAPTDSKVLEGERSFGDPGSASSDAPLVQG